MYLLEKFLLVLFKPIKFFEEIKSEKNIKSSLIFLSILSFWFWFATRFILNTKVGLLFLGGFAFFANIIYAFLVHFLIKLMGAKKNYVQTLKPMLYATAPQLLFNWIPLIGSLFSLWTIILQIIGVSKLQEISKLKILFAIVIAIVPFVVLILWLRIL